MEFSHGELVPIYDAILDALYYWKYEEKHQEAKRWNGPYIKEQYISKDNFKKEAKRNRYISDKVERMLAIVVDEKCIGSVSAYWVSRETNWLEIGIVIYDKQYWGYGMGAEVFQQWIDYLFNQNFVHRLGIATWSGNTRMIGLAKHTGMIEEARVRQARQVAGTYYDAIKMGILKTEWLNKDRG
ncbi:GNAT family protein [Staphylococcus kloosii]|uniref:GNAT family N-acetyltransferase n=1 Tax=Staphylococcus kloosii TaxID=29384 RepID=UPI0028A4DA21|nr:GNAT family protein [Staphylococcus kloosii]MDT3960046.1 GNAT family protein [Staphylococcus kloosii]